jgi:hypothetical protein
MRVESLKPERRGRDLDEGHRLLVVIEELRHRIVDLEER